MGTQSLQLPDNREDAVLMLAKRAAVGRCTRMEKAAVGGDSVRRIFEWLKDNPPAAYALLGAAGGAGMGGLLSATKDEDERTPLASMATGALAGGGLGLGAGLLSTNPAVREQLDKLPSWADVKGGFSEGWEDFKGSFSGEDAPPPDAVGGAPGAAPASTPEYDPALTLAEQEELVLDYRERNNLGTREEYANFDADGQSQAIQRVETHATSNSMGPGEAIGSAAMKNSPVVLGAGGVLAAAKAIKTYRAAGPQFMEGLSTKPIQDALNNQKRPWVGGELMNTPPSQQGRIGRAGAWWNPKRTFVSPAVNVPHPNPPATPAGQWPKHYDENISRPFADQIKRHGAKSLAETAAATAPKGLIMRNLKPGRMFGGAAGLYFGGKTLLDASKMHDADLARQYTSGGGG